MFIFIKKTSVCFMLALEIKLNLCQAFLIFQLFSREHTLACRPWFFFFLFGSALRSQMVSLFLFKSVSSKLSLTIFWLHAKVAFMAKNCMSLSVSVHCPYSNTIKVCKITVHWALLLPFFTFCTCQEK